MADRSTFIVHLTSDETVWVEVVATGEVISVADLDLVGATIERCRSEGAAVEDFPAKR
ncbi:hypothetical protein BDK89_4073 [Ilumatobacter fluminis]|uniref:Uncharacterized protein n=1 Tax=Ilumatobacter fluminis TaxID=467091 RepID=A0A4R7I6N6_9ACTN|nr:hypothetical protein [Ilumatobacter fluminis]TDT18453.1 hypothetical protein BDK89_4073 [Ilumatobacter fluminis]